MTHSFQGYTIEFKGTCSYIIFIYIREDNHHAGIQYLARTRASYELFVGDFHQT